MTLEGLERLTIDDRGRELFVRDGKIYEFVDMHGRGSDFDQLVSEDENDPRYAIQVAAWRLMNLLQPLCKTGRPHRMRDVPAHRACVDCGKHE